MAENETTQEVAVQKRMTIMDTQETSLMNPEIYTQMKVLANDFIASKAIPTCWQSSAQVLVGLQTGLEMGMTPMESMNSLYVVNGAVNIWGKATTKRIRDHGYTIEYTNEDEAQVTATVTKDDERYTETFRFADAEESGYTKDKYGGYKVGWKPGQNRKMKLRYGALNTLIKTYIPEVMGSATGIAEIEGDLEPIRVRNEADDKSEQVKRIVEANREG